MSSKKDPADEKRGISKVKIALGAAGLFLFIVGVKRSFRLDADRVIDADRKD